MPDSTHKHTNALAKSSSPYLKQHAHNPVDWMPWGEEAFEKARAENKLIFVSIGYSACHWCHVMEHQTFEDEVAAEFINKHFVSIKVDREERPDVDAVYMHAVQIMTGRGGWPLNCIALPDGRPIFGGTYFPKTTFLERLEAIISLKNSSPDKIEKYASELSNGVAQSDLIIATSDGSFNDEHKASVDNQVNKWRNSWDREMGLSMGAPKFPLPTNLDFLLHYGTIKGDPDALDQAKLTLDAMSRGGIYDQIGGGFARYSVDSDWKVPHFEKMLYDNAQLLSTYSHAYQIFKNTSYKRIVFETIDFINRELGDQSGGFYSALDADSEGVEGKYYVWTKDELKNILSEEEFSIAEEVYEIDKKSYWEHGNNVLMKWSSDGDLANKLNLSIEEFNTKIQRLNSTLFDERAHRERPGLDDKILTSWNALTVSGLCTSYRVFKNPNHLKLADKALTFIIENARTEDGGLHHNFHNESGHNIAGFLEDYAFTIKACIDMYESTFETKWLYEARDLLNYSYDKFYDNQLGTFWFTSSEEEQLFAKKQNNDDSVIPASNSTMAMNMFKLGRYFSREDWIERSDRMVLASWEASLNIRSATHWGQSLLTRSYPFYEIAITSTNEQDLVFAREKLDETFLPQSLLVAGTSKTEFPLWLKGKTPEKDSNASLKIFVCQEGACQLPVETVEDTLKQLNLN